MATRLLVPTVPGPTMPTLTPVCQVGPFVTTPSCGTSKRLSANSKARNQKCCLSVEAAAIATAFLPYFTKVFNLRIDDDTMRRRLQERTDDDWPLGQGESNSCSR